MGYSTEHLITVRQVAKDRFEIIDDIYDESEILGDSFISDDRDCRNGLEVSNLRNQLTSGVNSNIAYKVNAVIDYADSWVVHEYSPIMQNYNYYNLTTYGYYSADCANFVSQCMRAGGMNWDYGSGKNNNSWDGTQWWFDVNPNPNYENYNVSPPPWRFVSQFVEYWNNQGYVNVAATSSSVFPGNPVYVSNHVGICVGYNSSGTPIINAHNRDVYHVPYTMIGTTQKNTIQITTNNTMINVPSNATVIVPTSVNQTTSLKHISAGENHFYRFTISVSDYYTFESAYYSNTPFDTKAYLYKDSQSSNGQTLYMYEVAKNDDGGTGLNFKIRTYLTAGKYYLRVCAFAPTASGYYYLNYMRG